MSFSCGAWSAVKKEGDEIVAVPLLCRSWACPVCGPRMKRRLVRALEGVVAHTLITLTCDPGRYESPHQAFARMSVAVNQLMKRIRRAQPRAQLEYFLVWETTRRGWPHVHIIARAPWIPQAWLSCQWQELTGASIVDIRRLQQGPGIALYIAKYLSKQLRAPRGFKRYRSSRNFVPGSTFVSAVRPAGDGVWSVSKFDLLELARQFDRDGYCVHRDGHDAIIGFKQPCAVHCPGLVQDDLKVA